MDEESRKEPPPDREHRDTRSRPEEIMMVPMHAEHLDDLADLESTAFSRPWSYDALAEELQNPLAVFYVAEDVEAESAVGYLGMHHILDECAITSLVVHPAYQRRGIATRLLREAVDYGEKHQVKRLMLEVRAGNRKAIALYEKLGFKKDGLRPGFYSAPREDALLYSLWLD